MPATERYERVLHQQVHLLTFDVEHWYEGFRYRGIDGWQAYPPRDNKMVERLLDKLDEAGQQATMFFTGRYAEEFPHVVKRAAKEGHEVASHSYSHNVLSRLGSLEAFREDLLRSVAILEDIAGCKVKGYRAPKWSIDDLGYLEVLKVLQEMGLEYDSSVFPRLNSNAKHAFPRQVALGNGTSIWEVPATTYPLFGLRIPVAGGLYFRLLPLWITRRTFSLFNKARQPGMIYLHPYDLDPDCPRLSGGNSLFQWFRYCGVGTALDRLDTMLKANQFSSIAAWLLNPPNVNKSVFEFP